MEFIESDAFVSSSDEVEGSSPPNALQNTVSSANLRARTTVPTSTSAISQQPQQVALTYEQQLQRSLNTEMNRILSKQQMPIQQTFDVADFECSLCFRLLCKPISTHCGHTYCKNCLMAALRYSPFCPLCRSKLEHPSKHKYSVNIVLLHVLEKHFKPEYDQREKEEETEEVESALARTSSDDRPHISVDLEDYYSWSSCLIPSVRATCCVLLSCT